MVRRGISSRSTKAFIRGAPIRIDDGKFASILISGKWLKMSIGDSAFEATGPIEVSTVDEARRLYGCEDYEDYLPFGSEISEDGFLVFDAATDG